MKFHLFATTVLLSLLWTSVSGFPRFFPNITAIPPAILPNNTSNAWQSFQNFAGCHKGDRVDELGSLKQYLHRFGYIPDSPPSNFTDDFDDTLESAIRKYQLNFNLNTTGALDDRTLQQLVRPRCGVADIINGTSSMNSGKAASSTHSFHTVGHYSFFPSKPMWPSSRWDLTYAFYPGNQLTDSVKAVFSRAFDQWSAVTPLTFTETESYSDANIRIGFFTGDHGDGEPFDGVLGTLAHAFSPTDGRFHLDGDENWVLDGDLSSSSSSSASVIDLESVAVHEIGHLLGLGHSSVEEAIMYPTITSGTRKIELTEDDIEGIQVLYGSNPNYNGSSTTSTTATSGDSDTSGGGLRVVGRCWGMTFVMTAVGSMLFLM